MFIQLIIDFNYDIDNNNNLIIIMMYTFENDNDCI